jgi:hypothetical protein
MRAAVLFAAWICGLDVTMPPPAREGAPRSIAPMAPTPRDCLWMT